MHVNVLNKLMWSDFTTEKKDTAGKESESNDSESDNLNEEDHYTSFEE